MNTTLHLLVTLVLCTLAVRPLARARWVWRSPRTGILLWQMLGLTWVLCAVGAAFAIGLTPYDRDIPTALGQWLGGDSRPDGVTTSHLVVLVAGLVMTAALVASLVWSWVRVVRFRRRHRDGLALVAREVDGLPGVLVIDHPLSMAYCLPGVRPRVVLTSGVLEALSPRQVAAVLAHERTHARERHDLVLLPFVALRRVLPGIRLAASAAESVALLVEMRADQGACREQSAGSLVEALRCFSQNHVAAPPGALGIADRAIAARLSRLSRGVRPLPLTTRLLVLVGGLVLVSTPLSFLFV